VYPANIANTPEVSANVTMHVYAIHINIEKKLFLPTKSDTLVHQHANFSRYQIAESTFAELKIQATMADVVALPNPAR
jgi:hypothetical protein